MDGYSEVSKLSCVFLASGFHMALVKGSSERGSSLSVEFDPSLPQSGLAGLCLSHISVLASSWALQPSPVAPVFLELPREGCPSHVFPSQPQQKQLVLSVAPWSHRALPPICFHGSPQTPLACGSGVWGPSNILGLLLPGEWLLPLLSASETPLILV